jgi:hypothetical protein
MLTGFRLRTTTTRTTLSPWAARVHNLSTTLATNVYGPAVSATYGLGYYIEDYEYLGDVAGQTLGTTFDLNENNVRYCVTPEYPAGTWAYFCTIAADGAPLFPFAVGRQFYGTSQGTEMTSYPEAVTIDWNGGPNLTESVASISKASPNVTLTWNVVEGGTYKVETSSNLSSWTTLSTPLATSNKLAVIDTNTLNTNNRRFYRAGRTSLASFDTAGFDYTVPNATTFTFTFSGNLPPDTTPITGIKVGGVTGSVKIYTRSGAANPFTASVSASFAPTTLTVGQSYTAVLSVTGPPPQMQALTFTSTNTYTR